LEVTAGEQKQDTLLQQQHVALTAEKVAAVQVSDALLCSSLMKEHLRQLEARMKEAHFKT
jgi:hypothetical protein